VSTEEYVSVKDACKLLRCGRTKIYTHYINDGILSVKRKIGNRSFFLRSDIDQIISDEGLDALPPAELIPTIQPTQATQFPQNEQLFLKPDNSSNNEVLVTDYIDQLKTQIAELESQLNDSNEALHQVKNKLINAVPLLEYNQKLKENEELLDNTKKKLEQSTNNNQLLKSELEDKQAQNGQLQNKYTRSVEVAATFKNLLSDSKQKRDKTKELHNKLMLYQQLLQECSFWQFSRKAELKQKIAETLEELRHLDQT
jgi:predicted DNA-binding transcriptional regulator AlpA/chromosome segregation ATPase